jgi:hypothetical protein
MTLRRIAFGLWRTGALAAQTFIQMSDPQFGMYSKNQGFEHETANVEFAISIANRLRAFCPVSLSQGPVPLAAAQQAALPLLLRCWTSRRSSGWSDARAPAARIKAPARQNVRHAESPPFRWPYADRNSRRQPAEVVDGAHTFLC